MKTYTTKTHNKYGKYIDIDDFKNPSNTYDQAIQEALATAHKEKAALYLHGTINIKQVIEINQSNKNVTGIFGDGMGQTKILFTHKQNGVHNYISNDTPPEKAGIWIDNQNGKFISDLSIQYKHTHHDDFYRTKQSYFGKINGIVVNNADHTLISKVEVSGANRAGVLFTSTDAISSGAKAALINGKINANQLPTGDNNKIVDSYLHHNRVAGVMVAYQKMFTAENNKLAWNGHHHDGGTGYGFATQAGSYNNGIVVIKNTTDHNYRKGIDSHDANNLIIKENTLNGDRMFGIAVENRQFSMDKITIQHNKIIHDPKFNILKDDDYGVLNDASLYAGFRAIRLENKAQPWQIFHNPKFGRFMISDNIIDNLTDNMGQTRAIEVRNNEKDVSYLLSINNNTIKGSSADNLISIFGNPDNPDTPYTEKGPGSGHIRILNNTMNIGSTHAPPIYIEEQNTNKQLHGKIVIEQNKLTVQDSNSSTGGISISSNAETILTSHNTFDLGGEISRPVIRVEGDAHRKSLFHFVDNILRTDSSYTFENGDWLIHHNTRGNIHGNTHNSAIGIVGDNGTTIADILKAYKAANTPSAGKAFSPTGSNEFVIDNSQEDKSDHSMPSAIQPNIYDIGTTRIKMDTDLTEKVILHNEGVSKLNSSEALENEDMETVSQPHPFSDLLDSHHNSLNINQLNSDNEHQEYIPGHVNAHYISTELPNNSYTTTEDSLGTIL